jgi:hypothetical protein
VAVRLFDVVVTDVDTVFDPVVVEVILDVVVDNVVVVLVDVVVGGMYVVEEVKVPVVVEVAGEVGSGGELLISVTVPMVCIDGRYTETS